MPCNKDILNEKLKVYKGYNNLTLYHIHAFGGRPEEHDCEQVNKYINNGIELLQEAENQGRTDIIVQINEELKKLSKFRCTLK